MKKVEIFRQWCQNGAMDQAISLKLLRPCVREHVAIITYYEEQKAKGIRNARLATLDHFALDLDYFKYVKQSMYKEIEIQHSKQLHK